MKIALNRVRGVLREALSGKTVGSSADDDDDSSSSESASDCQRSLDSELCEVSDTEFWQEVHHHLHHHQEPLVTEDEFAARRTSSPGIGSMQVLVPRKRLP